MGADLLFVFKGTDISPKSTYKNNDFLQIFKIKFSNAVFRKNQFYFIQDGIPVNNFDILLSINVLNRFNNYFNALRIEYSHKINQSHAFTFVKNLKFMLRERENIHQLYFLPFGYCRIVLRKPYLA